MTKKLNVSQFQLINDRIVKLQYEVNVEEIVGTELKPYINIKVEKGFGTDKDKKIHKAILKLMIDFKLKKEKKSLLNLKMEIEGEFSGNIRLSEKEFKMLVIKSGMINLLSIARSKIIAISSLFGFTSPIYIPLLNLKSIIENELKQIEGSEN